MTSWSFSSFTTALQCLRKYKHIYVDEIDHKGLESGDLIFGSALHSAINAGLTGSDAQAKFEVYWSSYEGKEVEYGRFKWKELAQIGSEFLRKFEKYHLPKYKLEFAEKRLYAEYKGVKLEGTLDYFGLYNGKRSLRDFKTSGRNYDQEKAQCALQLYLYSFLWKQNGGTTPETLGYTVFNKGTGSIQDLTWDFEESRMYEALDQLVSYTSLFKGTDYPKNYGACLDYNRKCEYFDMCHGKKEEK